MNENLSPTFENERVLTKEGLARILRKETSKGSVAISLMAYSGLRPESLGNYQGTDGLRLRDLEDLNVILWSSREFPVWSASRVY
ncbi:MAG: hypothetical protein QXG73_01615 [Candidatus Micrarchaeaceae archaeon]